MDNCIFCKIIEKQEPADILFENDKVMAFFVKDRVCEGHTLLIPKTHCENIFDITHDDLVAISEASQIVANLLTEKYSVTGINILHASGKDAQQSIFHFHLHLIPRRSGDGLDMWIKQGL